MNPLPTLPDAISAVTSRVRTVAGMAAEVLGHSTKTVGETLPDPIKPAGMKWTSKTTTEAVRGILTDIGGPLSAVAIQEALTQRGRSDTVAQVEASLELLLRRKLVKHHGPALWDLA